MRLSYLLLVMPVIIFAHVNEIHKADSLDLIYQMMPNLNERSIVVFDRDDTLLQGVDCIGTELRAQFVEMWKKIYATEDTNSLLQNIESQKHTLVDKSSPALIKQLRAQGVNVIIMTRGCHGKGATGQNVEDLCIAAFRSVGIDLSNSFSLYSSTILVEVTNNGSSPLFKEGILFSNTCDKGDALEALLNRVQLKPEYIIFVDDKLHYVEEVQRAAQKNDIEFLGLYYRGAEKLPVPDLKKQCYRMCYVLDHEINFTQGLNYDTRTWS